MRGIGTWPLVAPGVPALPWPHGALGPEQCQRAAERPASVLRPPRGTVWTLTALAGLGCRAGWRFTRKRSQLRYPAGQRFAGPEESAELKRGPSIFASILGSPLKFIEDSILNIIKPDPSKWSSYPSLLKLSPDELQEVLKVDHGENWPAVLPVVRGKPAACPVDMLRARYSAIRIQDITFLAKTETSSGIFSSEELRMAMWEDTFGLAIEDTNKLAGGTPGERLRFADSLEIVDVQGPIVAFKICCGQFGCLYEQGKFKEDKELGYVYSINDIQESRWEASSMRKTTEASFGSGASEKTS